MSMETNDCEWPALSVDNPVNCDEGPEKKDCENT